MFTALMMGVENASACPGVSRVSQSYVL